MKTPRILVVEDEVVVSREIAERLELMGYQPVGRAASGEQCLRLVELQRPDLVLMDIRIKGEMDGIAAAEEIRHRFHLPVIFLTAYSEDTTLERAKAAEPYACIFKPVADRELKSAIEIALYKHRAEEEIRRLNRLYDVLSQVNQSVVRTRSREEMLTRVCRIIVQRGGIELAWIGWLDPATSRIDPVAHYGTRNEMLEEVVQYAKDESESLGNPGRAILEGRSVVCNECGRDICPFPSASAPAGFGYQSCGSFPLWFRGAVCGVLSLCTGEPHFFGEREVHLFEEIAFDVSFALDKLEGDAERERMERSLRAANERLTALFERARDAILIADPESGIILEANAEAARLLGRPRKDIAGLHYSEIYVPERLHYDREGFLTCARSREPVLRETVVLRPDGTRVPVEISGGLVDLGNGQHVLQGFFRDVTERRAAEEEAKRQREMLVQIFESAPIIMMTVDRDFRVRQINCTGAAFAGRPGETLLEALCGEVLRCLNALQGNGCGTNAPCALCPLRSRVSQTFETGEGARGTQGRLFIRRGGTEVPVDFLISTALVRDESTDLVLVIIVDITEWKRAEQDRERLEMQLQEAQKLEAIGTLAGGIAHDFNNILAPIVGYTEIALGEMGEPDSRRELLEEVLKAASRAKELVKQILVFSRHEQEKPMISMNIGSVVKEALKLLRATLPSTIEISQDIEKGVAVADGTQIHQVIVNLCTNAAHAMDHKGTLSVSLRNVTLDQQDLDASVASEMKAGPYLKLRVADSGRGMDVETVQHIFEPYFTTKALGKGTGLGLSVVHGIVKRHGGKIVVQSEPGRGSSFDVYIPAAEEKAEQPMAILENLPRGSERILIVDDEEMIVRMAAKMLTRLGYDVTSQTSPLDALNLFRSDPRAFDLIITDYTMPGMTGIDLAREIFKERPQQPIILSTGFNERLTEEGARRLGIAEIVMKPLVRQELAELVRRVLDAQKT